MEPKKLAETVFTDAKFDEWENLYSSEIKYDFEYHDKAVCPDCGHKKLCLLDREGAIHLVCEKYLDAMHTIDRYYTKKTNERCRACKCEWTCLYSEKQIRKADEGSTATTVCLYGCKVSRSG